MATGGKLQRKGSSLQSLALVLKELLQKRAHGLPPPFSRRRLQIIYAAKMALRIKI